MNTRTDELRELMAKHKLSPEDVGAMLNRKPQTVRIWRCKNDGRLIPEIALELLKSKVLQ